MSSLSCLVKLCPSDSLMKCGIKRLGVLPYYSCFSACMRAKFFCGLHDGHICIIRIIVHDVIHVRKCTRPSSSCFTILQGMGSWATACDKATDCYNKIQLQISIFHLCMIFSSPSTLFLYNNVTVHLLLLHM